MPIGQVGTAAGASGYSGRSGYSGYSGGAGGLGTSGYSGFSGAGTSGYSGFSGAAGGGGSTGTTSILLASQSVNLNEGTAAKQPLYTCPASRRCIVTNVVFQKWSGNGTIAVFQLGWNANADNIVANPLDFATNWGSGTTALNSLLFFDAVNGTNYFGQNITVGVAGDILGLKVTTPEGSALTAIVDVFGYLTDTSGVPQANILVP